MILELATAEILFPFSTFGERIEEGWFSFSEKLSRPTLFQSFLFLSLNCS